MNGAFDFTAACPVCGSDGVSRTYRFEDFDVIECGDCGNAWRSNMYDESRIHEIYCEDDYESNPYFDADPASPEAQASERFADYRRALDALGTPGPDARLLDIGCGTGAFLHTARPYGYALHGVEISPQLAELARGYVPDAEIHTGRFESLDLPPNSFDVITMWDVIEHVVDPAGVVGEMAKLLRPDGVMVFCTPDEGSLLARTGEWLYRLSGGRYWYPAFALHPPAHTYFFSRPGFATLLAQHGLRVDRLYTQKAFFEHSELASTVQKFAIGSIERTGALFDARYEMVVFARR